MLSKFNEFINESKLIQLINENYLRASGAFLEKLKFLSKKNKIADLLYQMFNNEIYISNDLSQNWIDVDKEDTVSFLSDIKADKILDDNDDSEVFSAKGRGTIKIGRFVKAFLTHKDIKPEIESYTNQSFTDKDIEEFVNLYKSIDLDTNKKFKIVKGSDIAKWYHYEKYAAKTGTLGGSCMRNVDPEYFDIYCDNEEVCSLLIYINEEKELLGRALVWELSKSPCEAKYFMDRVYTNSDSDVNKFKAYAEEKGWMYKYKMNSHNEEALLFYYNGKPVLGKIEVDLEDGDFKQYPFVDTLSFMSGNQNTLSNVGFKGGYTLDSTDGELERCSDCSGHGVFECNECDGSGEVDCSNCDASGEVECNECGGEGCKRCDDTGMVECEDCKGKGQVDCEECESGNNNCEECTGVMNALRRSIKRGKYPEYKTKSL